MPCQASWPNQILLSSNDWTVLSTGYPVSTVKNNIVIVLTQGHGSTGLGCSIVLFLLGCMGGTPLSCVRDKSTACMYCERGCASKSWLRRHVVRLLFQLESLRTTCISDTCIWFCWYMHGYVFDISWILNICPWWKTLLEFCYVRMSMPNHSECYSPVMASISISTSKWRVPPMPIAVASAIKVNINIINVTTCLSLKSTICYVLCGGKTWERRSFKCKNSKQLIWSCTSQEKVGSLLKALYS